MIDINFPYEKITQALNFFAIKEGGKINKMKAIKLIYFADRYHLRKYGELLSNDEYFALKFGPVPSVTKDILNNDFALEEKATEYINMYISAKEQYEFESATRVDYDQLSETDIEALNFAWDHFGDKDQFELAELTHEYPEWVKHEEQIKDGTGRVKMNLEDFIQEPRAKYESCHDLSGEEKEDLLREIKEKQNIKNLWK